MGSLLAIGLSAGACVGSIGGDDTAEGDTAEDDAALCVAGQGPDAGVAPLRRLTRLEYNNTVRDLLGDTTHPADAFLSDEVVAGFSANAVAAVDKGQLEDYFLAAEDIAARAISERLDTITSCDPADASCMHGAIADLGRRAFRRPLTPELEDSLTGLYDGALADYGGTGAFELVLQAILLSPHFLYHVELSLPDEGQEVVALDAYELASRLSYMIWASLPDDELFDAAEAGDLLTEAGLEEQARRLLADDRAKDAIGSFHHQWLQLDSHGPLEGLHKDVEVYPSWSPALAASMRAETETFTDHVIRQDDASLKTLLTAGYSFVDGPLAELYGVSAPADGMSKVELPDERSGVLTHASVLSSQAHAASVSWVLRGKFVREQLLCEELAAPPPDVDANAANDPDRLTNPTCAPCHQMMDPIGFGFDGFDGVGRSRDVDDDGEPVSTEGEIIAGADTEVSGGFDGVRGLAEQLSASEQVQRCYATQWYRYATRRAVGEHDACSAERVTQQFAETGDIRELIVAVVMSDGFRYRRGEEP
jgi:hypothetical protein